MSYFTRYKNSRGLMHTLAFVPASELGDGLGDDIQAEQQEQGIALEEAQDARELDSFWSAALEDARKDPDWTFSNNEDNAPLF